jgi:hypothetical protein
MHTQVQSHGMTRTFPSVVVDKVPNASGCVRLWGETRSQLLRVNDGERNGTPESRGPHNVWVSLQSS